MFYNFNKECRNNSSVSIFSIRKCVKIIGNFFVLLIIKTITLKTSSGGISHRIILANKKPFNGSISKKVSFT